MVKNFMQQRFKLWRETARFIKLGEMFVGSILKAFYRKAFSKINAQRIASKVSYLL